MNELRQTLRRFAFKLWGRIRLEWRLRNVENQHPILVYQMGKVGSTTLIHTLEQLELPGPVLQVHTLNETHLRRAIAKHKAFGAAHFPEHLIVSSILVRKLKHHLFPCRIITLTREPVSRAISFAFQDWQKKAPVARTTGGTLDVEKMTETVNTILRDHSGHADPTAWFERELNDVFGIDVFAEPYDHNQEYKIFRRDNVSVLVMRMEDLDRSLSSALEAFLGVHPHRVAIKRANDGAEKWYSDALQAVKDTYLLPPSLVQSVFDTQYFRHFYGVERKQLKERWTSSATA